MTVWTLRGRCAAVLFDLFDTLVRFNRERLPTVALDGRQVRSSVGELYPVAVEALGPVGLGAFYEAVRWSYEEAERRRGRDHREIPARERWRLCYARLGRDPDQVPEAVTARLLAVHMRCLAAAAEPMPGREHLLASLRGRYRLGLVSNFDYSPTVERILEEQGLRDVFEVVVVSDAVGWRKPSPVIFRVALDRLGLAAEACLFVGDRPELDVVGARGVGMAAVWLNPEGRDYPAGLPAPDLTVRDLTDLCAVLVPGP